MRFFLTILLAVVLSLNAAYAMTAGVCDALEHTQNHGAHLGHHNHDHDDPPADSDQTYPLPPAASDHHHGHGHPVFSALLSDTFNVVSLTGRHVYGALSHCDFVSAPHLRLDRPPNAVLA
ncbi:MAG: hypothetical protein Q8O31_00635 [Rhodocyclaceae bacterium]|nr:hypothetical protein [Rhodocyclaceae bacterium]